MEANTNEYFIKTVTATWGKQGEAWLSQLNSLIEKLIQEWSLTQVTPFANLSYNYVATALQNKKKPVVLKISCDQKLIDNEYRSLNYFAGRGFVAPIKYSEKYLAILMQQAQPGDTLKNKTTMSMHEKMTHYIHVAKTLASTKAIPAQQFTLATSWCEEIDRITDQACPLPLRQQAKIIRQATLSNPQSQHVCHGDLHLDNIVQAKEQWLAIDPKGIIGDTAFEASAFDLVTSEEQKDEAKAIHLIQQRTKILAQALAINQTSLLHWKYLRLIIGAQWFIEDNGDPSESITLAKLVLQALN